MASKKEVIESNSNCEVHEVEEISDRIRFYISKDGQSGNVYYSYHEYWFEEMKYNLRNGK